MKINKRLEDVFAHAVALTQSGRLKSTIYCRGRVIYILNQDHTVFLKFRLRKNEAEFSEPVSFNANDYDSNEVEVKGGEICFIQEGAGFTRVKSCRTPDLTPADVHKQWRGFELAEENKVHLHKEVLSLLDPALSHVEFSSKNGKLRIVQRNIYSGSTIKISRKEAGGLGLTVYDEIDDFKAIGVRTDDLFALFSFVDALHLFFPGGGFMWADALGKTNMTAIISKCRYDELGGTSGRKVKKKRRRQ